MDNQYVDPRTRKTKRAIRNAFAQLLSKKEFEKITISDISAEAEINRKTFYCYYSGIYQVIDEIENEIVNSFESLLNQIDLPEALKKPIELFKCLSSILDADRDFYSCLLSIKENVGIVRKINKSIKEKAKIAVIEKHVINEQFADTVLEYAISGMISVYKNWYLSDRSESVENVSEIIGMMYTRGIGGILEEYSDK